ncbi:phosphoribosylanthranilate isomerase [Sediminitomix flava]|uniref:N-(5'-phosphoribosyl)anthranilate isomerase n=1 Tax=Sediminitomix flava TaxID=379075 RepID=A0A315Z709_SEDFL|nr:phosphoribosylanthranilate isomerase [Sediminitomix flava]PWJ40103.1 phosphoribosylanthranilate isomerase [Sediminitomix flava]
MKWKVCGMRETANIEAVLALEPDYMGFIFYPPSPRFVGDDLDENLLKNDFPKSTKKVGVFVNASEAEIRQEIQKYALDVIQLHGSESPELCKAFQNEVEVIKVFGLGKDDFDFSQLNEYENVVDFFLFDTQSKKHGGTGKTFDWNLLNEYQSKKPYFLSGGIAIDNVQKLEEINIPKAFALDVNSKFEITPAMKNVDLLAELKIEIKKLKI